MPYNKSYYQRNKESVIQNQKQYRQRNLEYVKEMQMLWYQKNRFHITCSICRSKYLKHNQKQHFKTQKHQRGLHGDIRRKNKKQNIQPQEKEEIIEEQKIIPYKTVFVSKGKILWSLQL
jgi:hypothetical protein